VTTIQYRKENETEQTARPGTPIKLRPRHVVFGGKAFGEKKNHKPHHAPEVHNSMGFQAPKLTLKHLAIYDSMPKDTPFVHGHFLRGYLTEKSGSVFIESDVEYRVTYSILDEPGNIVKEVAIGEDLTSYILHWTQKKLQTEECSEKNNPCKYDEAKYVLRITKERKVCNFLARVLLRWKKEYRWSVLAAEVLEL